MKMTRILPVLALAVAFLPGLAQAEETTFQDPMAGRYRLDYCRFDGQDCGVAAAFAFCQQEGYQHIESYAGERNLAATTHIGDRTTCRGSDVNYCDGFAWITCSRDHAPRIVQPAPGNEAYPVRPDYNDQDTDGDGVDDTGGSEDGDAGGSDGDGAAN